MIEGMDSVIRAVFEERGERKLLEVYRVHGGFEAS
jgi:hypothetical protein